MHLHIATPMFGSQCASIYCDSLARLMDQAHSYQELAISYNFHCNSSSIPTVRNGLANEFLFNTSADFLLFIDADIGFSINDIYALVDAAKSREGIFAGTYLHKHIRWANVQEAIAFGVPTNQLQNYTGSYVAGRLDRDIDWTSKDTPQEVDYVGADFMLIPRYVLQLFSEQHKHLKAKGGHHVFFQAYRNIVGEFESEDVFFCRQVRALNLKVYLLPWIRLPHFGNHTYGGPPTEFVS